jgi:hypothetical protein
MESLAVLHQLSRDVHDLEDQLKQYDRLGKRLYPLVQRLDRAHPGTDELGLIALVDDAKRLHTMYTEEWETPGGFALVLEYLASRLERRAHEALALKDALWKAEKQGTLSVNAVVRWVVNVCADLGCPARLYALTLVQEPGRWQVVCEDGEPEDVRYRWPRGEGQLTYDTRYFPDAATAFQVAWEVCCPAEG